jgi:hypothetical protein
MTLTEREAQEKRLNGIFGDPTQEKKQNRPEHAYEKMRREIRDQARAAAPDCRCSALRSPPLLPLHAVRIAAL